MKTYEWTRNGMVTGDGEDGDSSLAYVCSTDHAAEVERLEAKAYETKCYCDGYMAELEKMDAEVERLTAERDVLKQKLNLEEYGKNCAIAGSKVMQQRVETIAAERDAAVAAKERAVEALRDLYKSLLIHEGEDIMGRIKGTWSSKAAEKACALIAEIIAGNAPATKGEGDE